MQSELYIFAPTRALHGGVGSYTKEFVRTFKGFKIVSGCKASQLNGSDVIKLRGFNRRPNFKTIWDLFRNFYKVEHGVFIYQGSLAMLTIFIMRIMCRNSIHIIIFHGLASRYTSKLTYIVEWLAARFATHCIFLTEHDRRYLNISSRYTKISNYSGHTATYMNNFESAVVVTVTRSGRQKNLRYNLKEMRDVPLSLHVYGVASHELTVNQEINAIIENNICFKRFDSPQNIYANKFAFILSTFSEGFPLSILEAASHRLPLIVSDIPELREVLGDSALYFKNNKPGQLSEKILYLKQNADVYDKYCEKSMLISQKYTLDHWQKAWSEVFKRLDICIE